MTYNAATGNVVLFGGDGFNVPDGTRVWGHWRHGARTPTHTPPVWRTPGSPTRRPAGRPAGAFGGHQAA
jgi:hypothetical protein